MTDPRAEALRLISEAGEKLQEAIALVYDAIPEHSLEAYTIACVAKKLDKAVSTVFEMCRDGRLMTVDGRIPAWVLDDYLHGKRQARKRA